MSLFRHSLPYLAAIAMLASSCGIENNEGLEKELRFHDGVFRIAQVCDIHYGCTETDKLARIREMVTKTVEDESPDLFVFTGDAVTGSDDAHKGWLDLIEIFDGTNVPWAVVLGNHDAEANVGITADSIFTYLSAARNIVNVRGAAKVFGHGNKALPILKEKNDSVAAVVYCIDSNDYPTTEELKRVSYYDVIHDDQIQWYIDESNRFKAMNGGVPVPSVAYYHICLPEILEVARDPNHHGKYEERCCPADINVGFFGKVRIQGDMIGMFVGHDHTNDFVGMYQGIALGYGRQSGVEDENDTKAPMGMRIVELKEGKREFDTWVYTASGGEEDKWFYPSGLASTYEKNMLPAKEVKTSGNGVRYVYYHNETGKCLDSVNDICKPANKVDEGITDKIDLSKAQREDYFGFSFDTYVNIPESGAWKMTLSSDDGSVLYLDDKLFIDNDGNHAGEGIFRYLGLEKGFHHIQIKYLENYDGNRVTVKLQGKNYPEMEIPAEWLFFK